MSHRALALPLVGVSVLSSNKAPALTRCVRGLVVVLSSLRRTGGDGRVRREVLLPRRLLPRMHGDSAGI